ncbi:hypothetical protein M770_32960 (plasmid) [Pseudomonas aeruginosa VRFPA03]|nr:hypothetical protein M770_32960 [Pseudomonas aeruginosa VRFPA03]
MLEFICGQYHVRPHSTTKQRPDLAWERGIYGTEKRAGAGLPPIIADKQKLYLDFADIEDRTIERYGMRWDNIEYWDEVLRPFLDAGEQRKFVVRRNPYDASRIYFLHPIEGTYCELRCEQITLPNVSVRRSYLPAQTSLLSWRLMTGRHGTRVHLWLFSTTANWLLDNCTVPVDLSLTPSLSVVVSNGSPCRPSGPCRWRG